MDTDSPPKTQEKTGNDSYNDETVKQSPSPTNVALNGNKGCENGEDTESLQDQVRPRAYSTTSDESVSILQRLFEPKYSRCRKVTWCIIVTTCSLVCFWQLFLRIHHYWDEPTAFLFTVERVHEIHFPGITICPAREPFHDKAWREAFQLPDFSTSPKANVSLEDIWNEYAVTKDDLMIFASCNESNFCDFLNGVTTSMTTKVLHTFWGKCVSLSRESPIEYRGASTYLEIFLRPGSYGRDWFGRTTAAQFFFHDPRTAHRHEAFLLADLWSEGRDTVVQIILKEYSFLNSSRYPCDSQESVIACKNDCIDARLDQVVNCSLPFMTSKWPACRNAAEAIVAFNQTRDFYYTFNSMDCGCQRQCKERLYSANTNTADKRHDNNTAIIIQFSDNLVERVFEEFDYSFSALVSDVGGSLGIFLGVSILSLLKICESVFDGINRGEKERKV